MKRQTLGLLCGAAAALFAPVAAQAAHAAHAHAGPASSTNDVLCLVFSMSSANSQDQKAQLSGLVGMAYYLGRIEGTTGSAGLQQRVDAEIASRKGQDLGALAHSCGETLQSHISGLNTINQHLASEFGPKPSAPGAAPPATTLKPIPSPNSH